MSKIFISYNHRDGSFAKRLVVDLKRLGATVWIDDAEIKIGDSLAAAIQKGITSSDYFAVVLSPDAVTSSWVQKELAAAFAQEVEGRVNVLPILLTDCDLPLFLKDKRYADFRTPAAYIDSLAQLAERLGLHDTGSLILSLQECESTIRALATARDLPIGAIVEASSSHFGTACFKARLTDGKGVIYCHASGQQRNRAFCVRKGIGWYYEYVLNGSISALGLPTSNEEIKDQRGNCISFFEGGYIEWSPDTAIAQAVATSSGAEQVIARRQL